ncbi:MAG: transcriptional regulator [Acidobacteria bacterium]|nr:transcriptional regulator [Acidobacteriota bacterium]
MLKCHYSLYASKPPSRIFTPRPYPYFPTTIGDYLRKKRLDLRLRQKDVAKIIQTTVTSIRNWENNFHQPYLQVIPAIINFLGFCPYYSNLPISQKLIIWRSVKGIRQGVMAQLIGIDQSTLARWEQGRKIPSFKQLQRIHAAFERINAYSEKELSENLANKLNFKLASIHLIQQKLCCDFKTKLSESELRRILQKIISIDFILYETNWEIGKKLIVWRSNYGLSQRQMAKLTGFAPQTICLWETGKRVPNPRNIIHIRQIMARLAKILI